MWAESEVNFWQQVIDKKSYNANYLESVFSFITSDISDLLIDDINKIPLRDNTKIYSEIVGGDKEEDNLIIPNINLSKLEVGNKVLALYEEDGDFYTAKITSFDTLKKIVNVVYDGFEDEGEYEVSIFDIENFSEGDFLFSDEIFDNETRNLIVMEKLAFPLENDTKVFAEYFVDGMYYLGIIISFDVKSSTYKIIFSGFHEEGVFDIESSKVFKCPDNCYEIASDTIFLTPFKFPEICNDKEELIDSYLLSKYHSDILYRILQEMIKNQKINDSKQDIPEFLKKYFESDNLITFDKILSIYVYTIFLGMCFLTSYHNI